MGRTQGLTLALVGALALAGCSIVPADSGQDDDSGAGERKVQQIAESRLDWVRSNTQAMSLDGINSSETDLLPLAKRLADATLVGLGEGTHGTKEFDDIRFRLFRHLVETGKTRYILLEEDTGSAAGLNAHLQGKRSLEEGTSQLLLYYRTDPYLELYQWIVKWNSEHPSDRINVYGVDSQEGVSSINQIVANYRQLNSVARPAAEAFAALESLRGYGFRLSQTTPEAYQREYQRRGWDAESLPKLEEERKRVAATRVNQLLNSAQEKGLFEASYLAQSAKTSLENKDSALSSYFVNTNQIAEFNRRFGGANSGIAQRDGYLAQNAQRVVKQYGDSAAGVYLAHDDHVQMGAANGGGGLASGGLLREALGTKYRSVLTLFDSGSFGASELRGDGKPGEVYRTDFKLAPLERGSFTRRFRDAGVQQGWLWLADASPEAAEEVWLYDPMSYYNIGGAFSKDDFMARVLGDRRTLVLPKVADAVLYVEKTTGAKWTLRPTIPQ